MQYVTEYRQVQRVVYKCVSETKDVDVVETVYDRVVTPGKRDVWVCVQKMKPMVREYTVFDREFKTVDQKVTRLQQVMKTVDQDYWVCERVVKPEVRQQRYYEPIDTPKVIETPVTVCKYVPAVEKRQVTCYQRVVEPVTVCGPCGPVCTVTCRMVPVTQTVEVNVMRVERETVIHKQNVVVRTYQEKTREVKVDVVDYVMKKQTRQVQVCALEAVPDVVKVTVCELKPRVVKENYEVCVLEREKRTIDVEEVSYKPREVKKTIQVTTWKTVADVVTVTVPVTVCVPCVPPPCK
jgi:hypothetical protein